MRRCETCGNDYDKCFEIRMGDAVHVFDSFECAIHALAPRCGSCGCRVIGHGVEANDEFFCCVNCAAMRGNTGLADRKDETPRHFRI